MQINKWFLFCAFLVLAMVLVGGFTRLTQAGLSITEWNLITGIFPPFTYDEWLKEFIKYTGIPEYKAIHADITLEIFKKIYYTEYFHRLLGRLVGFCILLPLALFYKKLSKSQLRVVVISSVLVGMQGIMGWFMVKSGLSHNIYISHYRLATHLFLAIILFGILFYNGITSEKKDEKFQQNRFNHYLLIMMIAMLFIQMIMGAFVAGLHAGYIYNTFPLMGNSFMSNEIIVSLSDQAFVQFIHRIFAYILFLLGVIGIYRDRKIFGNIFICLCGQIGLGILTLLSVVDISLAMAHQTFAFIVFVTMIYVYKQMKLCV